MCFSECQVQKLIIPNILEDEEQRRLFYHVCDTGFISTCPSYFDDWVISKDCESGPVSVVYYGDLTYRNSYCAICNLGDAILNSTLIGNLPTNQDLTHNEVDFVYELNDLTKGNIILFETQPMTDERPEGGVKCCRMCNDSFYCITAVAGSAHVDLGRPLNETASEAISAICLLQLQCSDYIPQASFLEFESEPETNGDQIGIEVKPFPNRPVGEPVNIPLITAFFGLADLSEVRVYNETVSVDSVTLCSDGTVNTGGSHYQRLHLSPSSIKVSLL